MIASGREERAAALARGELESAASVADGYWKWLVEARPAFVAALEQLTEAGGTPALVHCTAGKDRTGVLIALLLDAAGVQREAIVADYSATDARMEGVRRRLAAMPAYAELAKGPPGMFMTAKAAIMEHFLERLAREAGGAASWFSAAGASERRLESWRATILC